MGIRQLSDPSCLGLLYAAVLVLPDEGLYAEDFLHFEARMCLCEGSDCRVGIQFRAYRMEVSG